MSPRSLPGKSVAEPSSSPGSESNHHRLPDAAGAHLGTPARGQKQESLHHELNKAMELWLKQLVFPKELGYAQDGDVHYICTNGG